MTKTCSKCATEKPATLEYFHASKKHACGLRPACKSCALTASSLWWKAHPERRREKSKRHYEKHKDVVLSKYRKWRAENLDHAKALGRKYALKTRYGLTPEKFNDLVASQGGVCVICKRPENMASDRKKRLAIDHDHGTGVIRGLLCVRCNVGLGAFDENVDRLLSAVSYLTKHKKTGDINIAIESHHSHPQETREIGV